MAHVTEALAPEACAAEILDIPVIGVNRRKKQIDLSVRALEEPAVKVEVEEENNEPMPTAMEIALRQAMQDSGIEMPLSSASTAFR